MKLTGDIRCDFEKVTAENVKLENRLAHELALKGHDGTKIGGSGDQPVYREERTGTCGRIIQPAELTVDICTDWRYINRTNDIWHLI